VYSRRKVLPGTPHRELPDSNLGGADLRVYATCSVQLWRMAKVPSQPDLRLTPGIWSRGLVLHSARPTRDAAFIRQKGTRNRRSDGSFLISLAVTIRMDALFQQRTTVLFVGAAALGVALLLIAWFLLPVSEWLQDFSDWARGLGGLLRSQGLRPGTAFS
jgi:hypothetical protein